MRRIQAGIEAFRYRLRFRPGCSIRSVSISFLHPAQDRATRSKA